MFFSADNNTLKRIPLEDYEEEDMRYKDCMDFHFSHIKVFFDFGNTIRECVNGHYYYNYEELMLENGMEKFVAIIAGMLFQIQHEKVESELAHEAYMDIKDFETGDYDDLFTPDDLKLIKSDIKTIKDYITDHPKLLED